jgi:malate synthase
MTDRVGKAGLQVAAELVEFIETLALPGTGISAEVFWEGLSSTVAEFHPRIQAALEIRADFQSQIDAWHVERRGQAHDAAAYEAFLREIGYLIPEGPAFEIETQNVDPEIATIAGPQLVVPVMNARFALNAANARWGSLYDAFYGTDAIGDLPSGKGYDADRGARVISKAKVFLDEAVPLQGSTWATVSDVSLDGNALTLALANPNQFKGSREDSEKLVFLFENNGLKIEVVVDVSSEIGASDPAGISDVRLESALSAIMDCEDSVAAVDAEDKVIAYTNWLGLMAGDLEETFDKGGQTITRKMHEDAIFTAPDGSSFDVKTRAVMLVRNVGHLMTTPAVLTADGAEIGEGILDAMVTTLCAMHDIARKSNSATGSVYVVKPKMHGPAEVTISNELFSAVEAALGLSQYTVKLGIMDEERRTSANLGECIRAARHRVAFINTGFLDRTGDEIHTSMEAGPMLPKGEMKAQPWIASYEDRNVDIGLACGLRGKAQIGKGMWAMPDAMAEMLEAKIGHPMAGANCAWVPSPTAATLHAMHYHKVNVQDRQAELAAAGPRGMLADLLTIPVMHGRNLSPDEIEAEIDNSAQGILGYVVRWVDQGVGCSKVPDIHDVALMEDRATCRISSQALANWLHHGVISLGQVDAGLQKMAVKVDAQNVDDPAYTPMAPGFDGPAYLAARALVVDGRAQPSGYTEPLLHTFRAKVKAEG